MSELITTLERIATALETIAGNCEAAQILDERRENHREYIAKLRAGHEASQGLVNSQKESEREEAEKETFPPAPPIENKGEEGKGKETVSESPLRVCAPACTPARKDPPKPRIPQGGRNIPPTREEVAARIAEMGYEFVDIDAFMGHYESNGWKVGRVAMKSWWGALAHWQAEEKKWHHIRRERESRAGSAPVDPKVAAFERDKREAEERHRRAVMLADAALAKISAAIEGGAR